MWAGIAAEVGVLLLIVYVPFLQSIFGTAGFPAQGWGFLLLCVPALLLADEGRKALLRFRERRRPGDASCRGAGAGRRGSRGGARHAGGEARRPPGAPEGVNGDHPPGVI